MKFKEGFVPDGEKFFVDFYKPAGADYRLSDQMMFVHHPDQCSDQPMCGVHRTSLHHMILWPRLWDAGLQFMWRICPHQGIHPDPDEAAFRLWSGKTIFEHVCDGCCQVPE